MKLLGHSPHQILIVFPVGLLMTAVVFDLVAIGSENNQFLIASYWMIAAGIVGGAIAAVFGFLDWRNVPSGTRANRIGIVHGLGNAVVLVLFIASWMMRPAPGQIPDGTAFALSVLGAALLVVTGWLGGELVSRLSVGVDEVANVNAPNSLRGHRIIEQTTSYKTAA